MKRSGKPWWQHDAAIAWALILFFPLGLFMMWRYAAWRNRFKWLWTGVAAIVVLLIVAGAAGGGKTQKSASHVETTPSTATAPQEGVVAPPTMTTQEVAYVAAVATQEVEHAQVATAAAEQTKAAQPTNTPVPTRTPVPPRYKLALISASCTQSYGYNECKGFVKNITAGSLENVEVVITWVDQNGTSQSADQALIDYNPILSGQESPWSTIGTYNPALTRFRVQFKDLLDGTILTRDDRQ